MLIRFAVENSLSLRDEQVLSFVSSSSLKDRDDCLLATEESPSGSLLPVALVYGANASGKSNLVASLAWMKRAVLLSHSQGKPGGKVPRRYFALDDDCENRPTRAEIDFVADGVRYHYGFSATQSEFAQEWLYSFRTQKRHMLFEREGQEVRFGRSLRGPNATISKLMRNNSLFLSAAAQNDHEELSPVAAYFNKLVVADDGGISSANSLGKNGVDPRVTSFLEAAGTGVSAARTKKLPQSEDTEEFRRGLVELLKKHVQDGPDFPDFGDFSILELGHRKRDGSLEYFDLSQESRGTLRLLVLLSEVFASLDEGTVLIVDELDSSLHTQACESVLELFQRKSSNPKGAQLLATTHDTNLMSSEYLRRDQIWFAEKSDNGATHVYPLSDLRLRRADNIERGYLQGRFGAIPFSGARFWRNEY